jgi:hypothetical protein
MRFIHPDFENEAGDYSINTVWAEEVQLLFNAFL